MKTISYEEYGRRVQGCFLGKAVGGTLGMPFEGKLTVHDVRYYDPVPETMVPNDDLDLQVTNLELLRRHGLPVNRHHLSAFWSDHMTCFPDEYGVANHNRDMGLYPPLSGRYANAFYGGMGAALR
ncbi:MAG TPA: ADP-ribosylglycohydrolase family protein, partial [Clostridia bacterium]|nr:ADP-ribosylglycohydrolase family protein [Clostridia bacterium]